VTTPDLPRPRDIAVLLLADSRRPPRQRARDQQADRLGLQIHQELLRWLVERDPERDNVDAVLLQFVDQHPPPAGAVRAVAMHVRDELQAAWEQPAFIEHLLTGAVEKTSSDRCEKQA
jgi:hypothetical protein